MFAVYPFQEIVHQLRALPLVILLLSPDELLRVCGIRSTDQSVLPTECVVTGRWIGVPFQQRVCDNRSTDRSALLTEPKIRVRGQWKKGRRVPLHLEPVKLDQANRGPKEMLSFTLHHRK
ncbi:hypothetical protein F511_13091 [Dorcoceras hygrometricum]|uniref:Uncharacterized protein n=1 Tax=Dorcoceras hygrometricum TaxID=472368 RepID=A0A2Z7C1T1_9LAMI|nr:hypothetical protein F511_13091 [Dorcoceras hygrometricum]